jgi:hypothetical protein
MARNAVFYFVAFLASAFVGFWPTYFLRIGEIPSWRVHFHGALMLAWCLLLIAQAWLIRAQRRPWHRQLGKVSFVLVPLILLSSVVVEHASLVRDGAKISEESLFFAYLIIALLAAFVVAFALAIVHRKTVSLHMRYMICTPLAMLDPVFARILGVRFEIGYPTGQIVTFAMIDGILLWLCFLDRNTSYRAFHRMLAVYVVVQIPAFFLYKTTWWAESVAWFARLQIS